MRLLAWAAYRTDKGDWRQDDHNASKLIKALKGDDINMFAKIPTIDGNRRRLTNSNRHMAAIWFAEWAARRIDTEMVLPVSLVPVPNSEATAESTDFATARLAEEIAARSERVASAAAVLRWVEPMPKSRSQNGLRNKMYLATKLRLLAKPKPAVVVLVDDVCTSGSHLHACRMKLREAGCPVLLAVCAGRTGFAEEPFNLLPEDMS